MTRILFILLLVGQFANGQTVIRETSTISTDTIIGDTVNNSPNAAYNNKIKLAPIDKSIAKVDIRLYSHHSLSNTTDLRRIFLVDTLWNASEFVEWNKPKKIKHYSLAAKSDFDSIFIQLLSANIMTLPKQTDLKQKMRKNVEVLKDGTMTERKMMVTDGVGYTIEIKIGDKYRIYQFDNPESYAKFYEHVSELQDYVRIVKIFENELKRTNNR